MKQDKMAVFIAELQEQERLTQRAAVEDYANQDDVLANFKEAAAVLGVTPVEVAFVYLFKHWCALRRYIRDGKMNREDLRQRIVDLRLYLALLLALEGEGNE